MKNHKWSEHFKHQGTWYRKCLICGIYKIYLMSKAYYKKENQEIGEVTYIKPKCNKN